MSKIARADLTSELEKAATAIDATVTAEQYTVAALRYAYVLGQVDQAFGLSQGNVDGNARTMAQIIEKLYRLEGAAVSGQHG